MAGLAGQVALLHVHCAERGSVLRKAIFLLLGKLLHVPVVLHLHGAEFEKFYLWLPGPLRAVVRALLRQADRIVVLGSDADNLCANTLGVSRTNVRIAHNGTFLPHPRPRGGTGCRVLFAGTLGARKGLADLLTAIADLRLAGQRWELDIAGPGNAESFRAQAEEIGILPRIRFHGWLPPEQTQILMHEADLLVLPSRNEGLPMVILEAMAHGLAVIATPVGSVADAVQDGVTGLLVRPGDTEELARALLRLIPDSALRRAMGEAGRARVARHFTVTRQNDTLEAIFAPLLAQSLTIAARAVP
jgi:glycosyltransferase involved in cell wall biosynthesis